jgi:hypothetical protein
LGEPLLFLLIRQPYIYPHMRVVGEIRHPELKITIFHWNNRYLIKLEAGLFEQTFKVQEYDVASEEDVKKLVTEEFIQSAINRFNQMGESLQHALSKL